MILFGPAGTPLSCKSRKPEDGAREVARLGLGCMEVEFVYGVRMTREAAAALGQVARDHHVALTAHGPYYINLCSAEPEKAEASVTRILDTARRCHDFGGRSITFHAAFFQKSDPEAVFATVRDRLRQILATLAAEKIGVAVAPELTGKPSQFGSIDDLVRLCREVPGVRPCIDFSHHAARHAGADNSRAAFAALLAQIRDGLGPDYLRDLHMHVSGIEWTAKGEKKHHRLSDSPFDWRGLLSALVEFKVGGIMVCESPVMEEDALVLQKEYRRLAGKK